MDVTSLLWALLQLITTLSSNGWLPVSTRNGIAVYRRDRSAALVFRAQGTVDAPPSAVEQVLLDFERHPQWASRLVESRILERGADWLTVYQRLSLPFIDDRDFTLRVQWGDDGDRKWLRFTTANDRGPDARKHTVRVAVNEGSWQLEPIDEGRGTFAVYEITLEMGGSFPVWMGRGRAIEEVFSLFMTLRAHAHP